ncbi:hypothetical protein DVZ84_31645 [Streptomyces parvulus]|uniref:Uncharacterized protein n=1 Tax=Streptomyces parvulus TaxID=146923 RepID=A0A369UWD3_9ACTN|nr:hypothetical protein DVZ84_31645 [Streptomyces parvulus]
MATATHSAHRTAAMSLATTLARLRGPMLAPVKPIAMYRAHGSDCLMTICCTGAWPWPCACPQVQPC